MAIKGMFKPILYYSNNRPIKNFTIIGERHSGTNWLEKTIKLRFGIPITWEYGFKHWIKFPEYKNINNKNTLFFCINRNIYNWINSFYLEPHHITGELRDSLINFISMPWAKRNIELNYINNKPYKNIFDLRKSKIEYCYYFLPFFVDNTIYIKYEDLQHNMKNLIDFLSYTYKMNVVNQNKASFLQEKSRRRKFVLSDHTVGYINDHAYWKYEKLLGYSSNLIQE